MIRIVLTLTFVALSLSAHGLEMQKVNSMGTGQIFYTLAGEGDHFLVSAILESHGSLPVKLWERSYADLERARAAFDLQPGQAVATVLKELNSKQAIEILDVELWPVVNQWSEEWEQQYRLWVEQNVDREFMVRNNVQTDCADVAYSLRWIFSRNNGLPAVNRLASGSLFSHRSVKREWLNLPTHSEWQQDQRFLAALNYLLDLVYTHSLETDSYPLKIQPDVVIPGAHFLYISRNTGHTLFVYRKSEGIDGEAPLRVIASTTPRQVRTLYENPFYDEDQPTRAGFMKMRWPVLDSQGRWVLTPATAMPNYSREQYQPEVLEDRHFHDFVFDRVAPNRVVSPAEQLRSLAGQVYSLLEERLIVVEEGFEHCAPDRCPVGSEDYEAWSTPSRDARILSRIHSALALVERYPSLEGEWDYYLEDFFYIEDEDGYHYPRMRQLVGIWLNREYASDPNLPIRTRWGL